MKTVKIILAAVSMLLIWGCTQQKKLTNETTSVKKVSYVSQSGNYLKVMFDQKQKCVTIFLGNGQKIILPRALSASGTRYKKGQDIFWEHHGTASFWKGDTLIFRGSIVPKKD